PLAVAVEPGAEESRRLDLEPGLLAQFAAQRVDGMLGLVEKAAGHVPRAAVGIAGATDEQQPPFRIDEQRTHGRLRVRVRDQAGGRALDALVRVFELRRAPWAVPPAVDSAHAGRIRR